MRRSPSPVRPVGFRHLPNGRIYRAFGASYELADNRVAGLESACGGIMPDIGQCRRNGQQLPEVGAVNDGWFLRWRRMESGLPAVWSRGSVGRLRGLRTFNDSNRERNRTRPAGIDKADRRMTTIYQMSLTKFHRRIPASRNLRMLAAAAIAALALSACRWPMRQSTSALRALLLALALSGALLPAGAQERPHLSGDPEVNRARALIEAGHPEVALTILRPLAAASAGGADRTDIRFLTGLAATLAAERPGRTERDRDALLDEAIAAFRAILVEHPGLVRVRLELARAFYLKREDKLAREHFERVLAGNPNPVVVGNVRNFLGQMRARRRWSAHFGMALASDSNLNAASGDDTLHISIFGQVLPFSVGGDAGPKPGLGVYGVGRGPNITIRWAIPERSPERRPRQAAGDSGSAAISRGPSMSTAPSTAPPSRAMQGRIG